VLLNTALGSRTVVSKKAPSGAAPPAALIFSVWTELKFENIREGDAQEAYYWIARMAGLHPSNRGIQLHGDLQIPVQNQALYPCQPAKGHNSTAPIETQIIPTIPTGRSTKSKRIVTQVCMILLKGTFPCLVEFMVQ
jgi:hypothetical protein